MGLAVSQSPLFPLLYEAKMGSAGCGHGPSHALTQASSRYFAVRVSNSVIMLPYVGLEKYILSSTAEQFIKKLRIHLVQLLHFSPNWKNTWLFGLNEGLKLIFEHRRPTEDAQEGFPGRYLCPLLLGRLVKSDFTLPDCDQLMCHGLRAGHFSPPTSEKHRAVNFSQVGVKMLVNSIKIKDVNTASQSKLS